MESHRKLYPSDVSDEEWSLLAPYLTLQREDAGQREHSLREVFNGLRYIVKTGAPWRWMPNDLPPWAAVYQQTQRWLAAGCFEALIDDLRAVLRLAAGRKAEPSAAIIDSRTLRSTPESGERAGYDGAKRKKGSKLHIAVDTLGHLLALHVTPASAEDRGEIENLARTIQAVTGDSIEIAWVDQGYTGERAELAADQHGIDLKVVKLPEAKRGFILLPRRWVVERSFAWATRFRRLVKDYERYAQTLAGLHLVAFATLMAKQTVTILASS
ncbi:IS5 family transposase [Neoaquamicrobium sediminum]|uniref:IS5 family transposase n=1 Tax=Neoaquamicrobium sediminum TaxID=1849104 RepID=UPI001566DA5A|nr:IS5 family transposase [Mesorhizobium sediminum]NRC57253.1 IS5 family transposase [Mesorhizobium sediminum]